MCQHDVNFRPHRHCLHLPRHFPQLSNHPTFQAPWSWNCCDVAWKTLEFPALSPFTAILPHLERFCSSCRCPRNRPRLRRGTPPRARNSKLRLLLSFSTSLMTLARDPSWSVPSWLLTCAASSVWSHPQQQCQSPAPPFSNLVCRNHVAVIYLLGVSRNQESAQTSHCFRVSTSALPVTDVGPERMNLPIHILVGVQTRRAVANAVSSASGPRAPRLHFYFVIALGPLAPLFLIFDGRSFAQLSLAACIVHPALLVAVALVDRIHVQVGLHLACFVLPPAAFYVSTPAVCTQAFPKLVRPFHGACVLDRCFILHGAHQAIQDASKFVTCLSHCKRLTWLSMIMAPTVNTICFPLSWTPLFCLTTLVYRSSLYAAGCPHPTFQSALRSAPGLCALRPQNCVVQYFPFLVSMLIFLRYFKLWPVIPITNCVVLSSSFVNSCCARYASNMFPNPSLTTLWQCSSSPPLQGQRLHELLYHVIPLGSLFWCPLPLLG